MDTITTTTYEAFTARVIAAIRADVASADMFSEQDVVDIFEHVEDSLIEIDPAQLATSPEAYAARLLQRSALVISYRPGWRELH